MTIERVSIVGLGLIGGSIGAACRRAGAHVRGFDTSAEHLRLGRALELADAFATRLDASLCDTDVIVVATPVGTIADVLTEIDAQRSSKALIVDTGSVKSTVVRSMQRMHAAKRAIGGHPVAGKELAGPAAADADLLHGHPFVLTPTPLTTAHTVHRAREFVSMLEMEPVVMDAERHDVVLARTSHLPQLLSSALALAVDDHDIELTGPGFRDMSRLARSDPRVWRDILFANDVNVAAAVDAFVVQLQSMVSAIEHHDSDALTESIERGRSLAERAHSGTTR
ncbi:MAG: hypothetical protein NVS2B16_18250 [Chloroflexota bacterium]